jgi:trehalose synthase
VITAVLGISDLSKLTADDIAQVKKVHLLLAMFNALQPGVFALSGWDLTGMLTLDPGVVADLIADGDTRWINRGAHDLMGANPGVDRSAGGLPIARSLYGTLREQLADAESFASQLRRIIEIRTKYAIATSAQVDIPEVSQKAMLVLVHKLSSGALQITALNFSGENVAGTIRSEHLQPGWQVTDTLSGAELGVVDDLHSFAISLDEYGGMSLLVEPARVV